MEATQEKPNKSTGSTILDLSIDSLAQCASHLEIRDLACMSMTCKQLRDAVYVDSIWENQCRRRWPPKQVSWGSFQYCGGRNAYKERYFASQKFQFQDPEEWHVPTSRSRVNNILIQEGFITVSQGPCITTYDVESQQVTQCLQGHTSQVTSMRYVPSAGLMTGRRSGEFADNLLVTSSMDHTIRIWFKGRCLRTLRGHSGPVTTLSNSLLGGHCGSPVLGSGGMDGAIRLWSVVSGQKRGQSPLLKTFHAHSNSIKQLVTAEYNPSLLISTAKDLKVRVWDVTSASSVPGTGALVGSTKAPGVPVGLVCKNSTCFVAGGSSIMLTDIRSMQTTASFAAHELGIVSFSVPDSCETICSGGSDGNAKLWDLRNFSEPYAVLGNHVGEVDFVHMDNYKAVTGGCKDGKVYIWDASSGEQLNMLEDILSTDGGLTAMTVKGTCMATATSDGYIHFRDYSNCAIYMVESIPEKGFEVSSKFWENSFNADD